MVLADFVAASASLPAMHKRRRLGEARVPLEELLHTGRISMAGLADLMSTLGHSSSRHSAFTQLRDANSRLFDELQVTEHLTLVDGRLWDWKLADPGRTLTLLLSKSVSLQELYAAAWARSPPTHQSPWSLVVGFDEFTPGNQLSTHQSRKSMVVSFTFAELGGAAISSAVAWTTCIVVRSKMIEQVTGLSSASLDLPPVQDTQNQSRSRF